MHLTTPTMTIQRYIPIPQPQVIPIIPRGVVTREEAGVALGTLQQAIDDATLRTERLAHAVMET